MSMNVVFKRHLRVVTKVEPPFTNPCVFLNPHSTECDGGINFEIFSTLMSILEDDESGFEDTNGTWIGMAAQLMRDFSVPVSYYMSGFLIATPTSSDIKSNSLSFLASPFSKEGWICLFVSLLLVALVFTGLKYVLLGRKSHLFQSYSDSVYRMTAHLLRQPYTFAQWDSMRYLLGAFELAIFFLFCWYTSDLTSQILVDLQPKDPFSGKDQFANLVYKNKYTLLTDNHPDRFIPIANNLTKTTSTDQKLLMAYNWNPPRFFDKNDYDTAVSEIVQNKSLVFYNSYYRLLSAASKSCEVKVILDPDTEPTWLAFGFPKGSKLQELISLTLSLDATSVDTFMHRLYGRYGNKDRRKCTHTPGNSPQQNSLTYEVFRLEHIQGSLWVFLIGVAFSSSLFIAERIFYCFIDPNKTTSFAQLQASTLRFNPGLRTGTGSRPGTGLAGSTANRNATFIQRFAQSTVSSYRLPQSGMERETEQEYNPSNRNVGEITGAVNHVLQPAHPDAPKAGPSGSGTYNAPDKRLATQTVSSKPLFSHGGIGGNDVNSLQFEERYSRNEFGFGPEEYDTKLSFRPKSSSEPEAYYRIHKRSNVSMNPNAR